MALIVNEIFNSLQGESTLAGLPFVFIRLTGCNLRCAYCDTTYAYEQGDPWEIDAVTAHLGRYSTRRVTITGGEPLMQTDTPFLISALLDAGYLVSLETNGSLPIETVDERCIRVMDIKCPSSGMHDNNRMKNIDYLTDSDQVKFVITDRSDFDFAVRLLPDLYAKILPDHILFSAAHNTLPASLLAQWLLDDQVEARLQLQLHKYLWPDVARGV